jgi:hypothetical protein
MWRAKRLERSNEPLAGIGLEQAIVVDGTYLKKETQR